MFSYETVQKETFESIDSFDGRINLSELKERTDALEKIAGNEDWEIYECLFLIRNVVLGYGADKIVNTKKFVENVTSLIVKSRIRFALVFSLLTFLIGASCRSTSASYNNNVFAGDGPGRNSKLIAPEFDLAKPLSDVTERERASKLDFWQIAKVTLETDASGQSKFVNVVPYGERGYVFGLGILPLPYEVAGYKFVGEENAAEGVTMFWYQDDPEYKTPYRPASVPVWRMCDPSENVFEEGMIGMDTAGEGMKYIWNSSTQTYDGPFHSVNPGESGYADPLLPGGNISGYYPGCVLDLGSGGKYYFYHPVEIK